MRGHLGYIFYPVIYDILHPLLMIHMGDLYNHIDFKDNVSENLVAGFVEGHGCSNLQKEFKQLKFRQPDYEG